MIQAIENSLKGKNLCVSEGVELHINPAGGYMVTAGGRSRSDLTLLHISPLGRDILLASDGDHRVEEVVSAIGYPPEEVYPYIEYLVWKGALELSTTKKESSFAVSGSKSYFFPIHVVLEITSACNLRCSHCYRSAEREGEYMDIERIKPVLEQLFKNGCSVVEITGGEPMLHPQFFDLLGFLNQNPFVKTVAILTNGTLLNKVDMLQEYLQSKKFIVSTTIDSSSPNFHDEIRKVPGSWKRTVEFLREISKDTSVRVAMNVFPENVNDIEKTLILAKENGAFSFTASPIIPTGRGAGVDSEKYIRTIREYWKEMKHISRELKGFFATVPPKMVEAVALGQNCGAGHRSWVIGPNGNVRPCVMMADGLMNIGNVHEESLENICANKLLFSLFETQSPGSMAECRSCDYNTFCPLCIYKAICVGCDAEKKEIVCPVFSRLKNFINRGAIGEHTCYTNRNFLL